MNNIMAGLHGLQGCQELDIENIMKPHVALSIEIMDFTILMMNRQKFGAVPPAMFITSDLYFSALDEKEWNKKINKTLRFIQIHFISKPYGHFLLSMREDGQVSIYDSVNDTRHITSLLPQLRMIYEDFDENNVQYKIPQIQGNEDSNLCGFFAIANAVSLLNRDVPGCRPFKKNCYMRNHLYYCINSGILSSFPTCTDALESFGQVIHRQSPEEKNSRSVNQRIPFSENKHKKMTRKDMISSNDMKHNIGSTSELYFHKYKQPDLTDLNTLCKCCGENWYNLALFVSMADKDQFKNGIEVRRKVIQYFACVKERIKVKKYPKFDVLLHDVLRKIYLLMSTHIDWEKLKNAIITKGDIITRKEMDSVFEVVQNFETFWVIFNMPHLKVGERLCQWFIRNEIELDEIDKELLKLNERIETISSSNKNTKEKEKFLQFLNHDVLVKYASTSSQALLERIQSLSKVDVNFELLQKVFGTLGVPEGMENQMHCDKLSVAAPITDIQKEYVLENNSLIGVCVQSKLGTGSSGWCFKDNHGIKTSSTCAHTILGADQLEKLKNDYSGYPGHTTLNHSIGYGWPGINMVLQCNLDCYISPDMILFEVYKATYKQGSVDQGGVEIALIRMKGSEGREEKWGNESIIEQNILQQWKELELPRKLEFRGRSIGNSELRVGMEVYKIGNKTGITKGKVQQTEVKVNATCKFADKSYIIQLDSQVEVGWTDNQPFSDSGDSGALTFMLDESGVISAVGMVQSTQEREKRSFITPISHILNACEGCRLVPFTLHLKEKEPGGRTSVVAS